MSRLAALSAALLLCVPLPPLRADFHFWVFDEIFSTADGTIQFLELATSFDGQHRLAGHTLTAATLGQQFTFPADLPASLTAGQRFLLATSAFAALPGAVPPDYLIPAGFLSPAGDTVSLVGADSLTFGGGQLPLDGLRSFSPTAANDLNSPRNFAGQQGSVNVPVERLWHNGPSPLDVDDNGFIVPLDALQVINDLDALGARVLSAPSSTFRPPPFLDASGDGSVAPLDALLVINHLDSLVPLAAFLPPPVLVPEPPTAAAAVLLALGSAAALRRSRRSSSPR